MLSYQEIGEGTYILLSGEPYEVFSCTHSKKGRQKAVMATKCRHLVTGKTIEKTFHQSESVEEADVDKQKLIFIYQRGGEVVFHEKGDVSKRISVEKEKVSGLHFMKEKQECSALCVSGDIVSITPPIKVEVVVKEAPPNVKGNTAQGGSKRVVLETGAIVNTPLFIETDDTIEVNTQTGEYVRRV